MRPPAPVLQAVLLSDELKLDEIYCVELLLSAHEEVGIQIGKGRVCCLRSHACFVLSPPSRLNLGRLRPSSLPHPLLQRGDLSAESAAGIFFEERRGLLAALHRLLQVRRECTPRVPPPSLPV